MKDVLVQDEDNGRPSKIRRPGRILVEDRSGSYALILVDNHMTDGSTEYTISVARRNPDKRSKCEWISGGAWMYGTVVLGKEFDANHFVSTFMLAMP